MNDVVPLVTEPVRPPPAKRVWGGWATFGFGAAVLAVFAVVQVVVIAIALFVIALPDLKALSGLPPQEMIDSVMEMLTGRLGLLQSFATIISGVAGIGLIFLFIRLRGRAGIMEYLGLDRITGRGVLLAVAIVIGFYAVSVAVYSWLGKTDTEQIMYDIYRSSVWPALLWIAVVVFAPAFEEILFRGFLLEGFRQAKMGAAGAVIVTALAWAAMHALQYRLLNVAWILVLGIVMGIVRLKTRSLWNTITMHVLVNVVGMLEIALELDRFFA